MPVGVINAIIAFSLWGISPLFWKQLKVLPPAELIAWRIIFTFLSIFLILLGQKRLPLLTPKKIPMKLVFIASVLIAINWFVFIYAVNSDQVLQGSLGYFMGPMVSFFIGFIWLKEKIHAPQFLSLILFLAAIVLLTRQTGLPWISLTLAMTFAIYGLIKKRITLIPQVSLFYESLFVIPFCIGYLVMSDLHVSLLTNESLFFFITAGFFTYLPLHFFAKSAQAIPLSTLGVFQYIAPLGQFVVGRFWYGEKFEDYQIWAYTLVWLGIIIFTSTSFLSRVKSK